MKKITLTGIMLFFVLFVAIVHAQEPVQVQLETVKLTENVYMLVGQGGNIGVSTGLDGTLVIDSQFEEVNEKIEAAISEIGPLPVRFVLNTNWHYDHCLGNRLFAEDGATIIAHEKTRMRMMAEQYHPELDVRVPPYPSPALPLITFTDSLTLHLNGDKILAFHYPSAHSDADLAFYFKNANVLHTGDLFFAGGFPYIDIHNGGSINGMISASKQLLDTIDADTQIIPGHGPLSNKDGLQEYHDMLVEVRDRVAHQISLGASLEETIASDPASSFDNSWDGLLPRIMFIPLVYNSLIK